MPPPWLFSRFSQNFFVSQAALAGTATLPRTERAIRAERMVFMAELP